MEIYEISRDDSVVHCFWTTVVKSSTCIKNLLKVIIILITYASFFVVVILFCFVFPHKNLIDNMYVQLQVNQIKEMNALNCIQKYPDAVTEKMTFSNSHVLSSDFIPQYFCFVPHYLH